MVYKSNIKYEIILLYFFILILQSIVLSAESLQYRILRVGENITVNENTFNLNYLSPNKNRVILLSSLDSIYPKSTNLNLNKTKNIDGVWITFNSSGVDEKGNFSIFGFESDVKIEGGQLLILNKNISFYDKCNFTLQKDISEKKEIYLSVDRLFYMGRIIITFPPDSLRFETYDFLNNIILKAVTLYNIPSDVEFNEKRNFYINFSLVVDSDRIEVYPIDCPNKRLVYYIPRPCGDGVCFNNETCENCPKDCGECINEVNIIEVEDKSILDVESSNLEIEVNTESKNYLNYILYIIITVLMVGGISVFYFKFVFIKNTINILSKKILNIKNNLFNILLFGREENKNFQEVKETKKIEIISENITTAINISDFTVKYSGKDILNNVNFKIDRGKLVALIGGSGAGKSTIIEALVGRKKPNSGIIKIFNKSLKESLQHICFVPQHPEIYTNQTVIQNLKSSATKYGIKLTENKLNEILNKVNLSNRKELKANNLSGGQKKLLSLGMELIKDPELLILDEPTTGLDPSTRNQIITILSSLTNHHKKTVLITTHFMDDCEECDEVIIISNGNIIAKDSPQKLEKRLPGLGKVVNIVLDNVTEDLLKKIEKIKEINNIIREGRNLKILTNEPSAVKISQKIEDLGGSVLESRIVNATMKEVFVYYTGGELDD